MEKELIDRGTYYEIKGYESIIELDENGTVISAIHCPYIPKFLVDGPDLVSIDNNRQLENRSMLKTVMARVVPAEEAN